MKRNCNRLYSRIFARAIVLIFITSLGFTGKASAADGESLFKSYCASCHKPDADFVGPALQGARDRWKKNSSEENFYNWVKNPPNVIASGDAYAKELNSKFQDNMTPQPVTDEDIDAIFEYVESYSPDAGGGAAVADAGAGAEVEEESDSWFWVLIIGIVFIVIILSVGGVRRQLVNANLENEGKKALPDQSYFKTLLGWAGRNKRVTAFFVLILVIGGANDVWWRLKGIGVSEGYKPEQPIAFSHAVHAGQNQIDCQYCHSFAEKSKHAGIPSVNVCMNCHKGVQKGTVTGETEIDKIYAAMGLTRETVMQYNGTPGENATGIKWVKVHNLPDHVFFSHQQHVKVGGLECQNCHGDMTKEDVARVIPSSELNEVEGNTVKFRFPTLTMGWCIECHEQSAVKMEGNAYYDNIMMRLHKDEDLLKKYLNDGSEKLGDEKITVKELGGWECAKCHY